MLSFAAVCASVCVGFLDTPTDAALVAAADRKATETLSASGVAGLSIAIARNGKLVLSKGYGLAEVEHDVEADENSSFRIGSITKQFTAAAVVRLMEQDRLSLDDPITKYVPGYNTHGHDITVRHLLTHSSGITNYTRIKRIMVDEPERELARHELLDLVQNEPLAFEPGTKGDYSNTGYYLLGMIIEKASGKDYCSYLHDEFFAPLGLARTRCDSNTQIIKGRAQGYTVVGTELLNDRGLATGTTYSAGMLIASARDLVVWADALAAGKVVSPQSYKLMTTRSALSGGATSEYGLGFIIDSLEGHARLQHGGNIFGFSSMLARFPNDGLTIAVLSNCQAVSASRIADDLSRVALGIPEPAAAVEAALSRAVMARCEGVYTFPGAGWDVTITSREGKLYSQASDDRACAMVYVGHGEFRTTIYDKPARLVFDLAGEQLAPTFVLHEGGAALTATRKQP